MVILMKTVHTTLGKLLQILAVLTFRVFLLQMYVFYFCIFLLVEDLAFFPYSTANYGQIASTLDYSFSDWGVHVSDSQPPLTNIALFGIYPYSLPESSSHAEYSDSSEFSSSSENQNSLAASSSLFAMLVVFVSLLPLLI